MRIGFIGPSYTARSTAVADEECINLFAESVGSQGAVVPEQAYGGRTASGIKALYGTPGLSVFSAFPAGPVRGSCNANGRLFVVAGWHLYEVASDGTQTLLGKVDVDANPAILLFNGIQVLVVSAGRAFCFTLATDTLVEVTSQLAGAPLTGDYSDSYIALMFSGSNKFQISSPLDASTWPGTQVNEPSVFAGNISSICVNHREPWVFGSQRSQPYQDTGSLEVFDPIPGTMLETGSAATFSPCRVDNSVFWIGRDERGALVALRSNGYTPVRVSTYGVEYDLGTYSEAQIAGIASYSYQDQGHLFWMVYIPGASWSWCYDVTEGLWHKRAVWDEATATWSPHPSWNHVYAFGKHLVGDWNSGNLYEMSMDNLNAGRRLRRTPTFGNEMEWISHAELTLDFDTGQGPQPPFVDGAGNPRPPQVMLRWSDDRGKTWSNVHTTGCGFAGEYTARAIFRRLGRSRYRVYEMSVSDPIAWTLVGAYLRTA